MLGCQKEEKTTDPSGPITNPSNPDPANSKKVKGKVVLPSGSKLSANTLTVLNFLDENKVSNGSYEITADKEHSTLWVADDKNDVFMLGYLYPGQNDYNIDARSTTLALLMNMSFSFQISKDGRTSFVRKILADNGFNNIVSETESLIKQGISPLDTTQTLYARQLSKYLDFIAQRQSTQVNNLPVRILRSGKVLTFQNAGKSYVSTIGIYKDGKELSVFDLDRVNFVPTSEAQVLKIINGNFEIPDIVERQFPLENDGKYEIKIRNGYNKYQGVKIELGTEGKRAWVKNIVNFNLDVLLNLMPVDGACAVGITQSMSSFFLNFIDGDITMDRVYDLQKSWLQVTGSGIDCLDKSLTWKRFGLILKKYFGWSAWISRIGTSGNLLIGVGQYKLDKPAFDTCLNVKGSSILPCDDSTQLYMESIVGKWKIEHHHFSPYFGWVIMETHYVEAFSNGWVHRSKYVLHDQKDQFGRIYPGRTEQFNPPQYYATWIVKRSMTNNYFLFAGSVLTFPVTSMVSGDTRATNYASKWLHTKGW